MEAWRDGEALVAVLARCGNGKGNRDSVVGRQLQKEPVERNL